MGEIEWRDGMLQVRGICFDARLVLIDSAQSFVWEERGGEYFAPVAGQMVRLVPRSGGFDLPDARPEDAAFFASYFDLDFSTEELLTACEGCEIAQKAIRALPGLRLLNQPPWETLVGFITSANNNVARIRRLNRALIERVGGGLFPSPEQLAAAGEACLRSLGFGYRAPYLVETARRVADGFDLQGLSGRSYDEAHRALMTLPGVGDKVACCVQLFSLGDRSAFPVDVWVRRAMRDWFGIDKKDVRAEALRLFGPQAGLVQQYLFHCARTGIISCNREREDVSYAGTLGERGDDHSGRRVGLAPARRNSGEV